MWLHVSKHHSSFQSHHFSSNSISKWGPLRFHTKRSESEGFDPLFWKKLLQFKLPKYSLLLFIGMFIIDYLSLYRPSHFFGLKSDFLGFRQPSTFSIFNKLPFSSHYMLCIPTLGVPHAICACLRHTTSLINRFHTLQKCLSIKLPTS